jgi:hypothetical protein
LWLSHGLEQLSPLRRRAIDAPATWSLAVPEKRAQHSDSITSHKPFERRSAAECRVISVNPPVQPIRISAEFDRKHSLKLVAHPGWDG